MEEKLVIIVPIYNTELAPFERETLSYNKKNFKKYRVVIISPNYLKNHHRIKDYKNTLDAEVEFFENKYFKSTRSYNKLMMSIEFYKRFYHFDYMLICQLDAVLLKPNLEHWCAKQIDYMGAPWMSKMNDEYEIDSSGNGGFSLRNIKKHLEVLNSKSMYMDDYKLNHTPLRIGLKNLVILKILNKLSSGLKVNFPFINCYKLIFSGNEDYFWAFSAKFFVNEFNLGNRSESLAFAFEKNVERCLELNEGKCPTGIHAWQKYNPILSKQLMEKAITE